MHIARDTVCHDSAIAYSYDPESLVNHASRFELYIKWRNHFQLLPQSMSNGTLRSSPRIITCNIYLQSDQVTCEYSLS